MKKTPRNLLFIGAISLLSACASTPEAPSTQAEPETTAAAPELPPEPEIEYIPIPEDSLYSLLVAEFAIKRKQYKLALGNYLDQAYKTQDPGIVAHAAHLARYLKAHRAAQDAALLWTRIEPDNPEAHFLAAIALSRNNQPRMALNHMHSVAKLGGKTNYSSIIASVQTSDVEGQKNLLKDVNQLLEESPDSADLLTSKSLLQRALGDSEAALVTLRQVIHNDPDDIQAIVSEAHLLLELKRPQEAFKRFESRLKQEPDNTQLRLQYARMLSRVDLKKAQEQFYILAEEAPEDADLVFSLALIYRENGFYDEAKMRFQQLLRINRRTDEAHYYLGRMAEQDNEIPQAIEHYSQVGAGPDFVPATKRLIHLLVNLNNIEDAIHALDKARALAPEEAVRFYLIEVDLLSQLDRNDDAYQLLNRAIAEFPDHANLLYARAMINEQRNKLVQMEKDLRAILKTDPQSTLALNALGYVLVDRTKRYDEAKKLINQAYELQPNDPAIMDSMGWLQYKLGKHQEALIHLQKAYSIFPDPEVAGHLGEVLWVTGDKQQAKKVWRETLEENPDHKALKAVIQRFIPDGLSNETSGNTPSDTTSKTDDAKSDID